MFSVSAGDTISILLSCWAYRGRGGLIMIRINNLKCPIDHDDELIKSLIVKKLGIDISDITGFKLKKRSLDARKKPGLSTY